MHAVARTLRDTEPVRLPRTLGWAAFTLWILATAASLVAMPGETLELGLIGLVGAVAWLELRESSWTPFQHSVALLVLAIPLLGTWPARKWQAGASRAPAPLSGLLNLHSLLLVAAILIGGRTAVQHAKIVSRPTAIAAGLLVAGGLLGAVVNTDAGALGDAWVAIGVPVGTGLVVAAAAITRTDAWRYLGLAVLGTLVPVGVGIASYVVSFGFPTSGSDLVFGKLQLFRPHLFQDVTFGNVGHFGDVVLLALPLAVVAIASRAVSTRLRIVAAVAAPGLLMILFFVLSRAALALASLCLVGVGGFLVRRRLWLAATVAVISAAAVGLVLGTPSVRSSFRTLAPASAPAPTPSSSRPSTGPTTKPARDASEQMRLSALHTGLNVAKRHLPFGVGSGAYPAYDPVHTAPHSLLVQVLAEDGVLGAAGLLLLIGVLLVRTWQLLARRGTDTTFLLRTGCMAGALAFLADGVVSGAPLALGQLNVWPLLLAAIVALVESQCGVPG